MSKARELWERELHGDDGQFALAFWKDKRDEIWDAHDTAETEADRVLCLRMHWAPMETVDKHHTTLLKPGSLEGFRETRRHDYCALLIKEAIIGRTGGNVPPDRLAAITRREVAARRMRPRRCPRPG